MSMEICQVCRAGAQHLIRCARKECPVPSSTPKGGPNRDVSTGTSHAEPDSPALKPVDVQGAAQGAAPILSALRDRIKALQGTHRPDRRPGDHDRHAVDVGAAGMKTMVLELIETMQKECPNNAAPQEAAARASSEVDREAGIGDAKRDGPHPHRTDPGNSNGPAGAAPITDALCRERNFFPYKEPASGKGTVASELAFLARKFEGRASRLEALIQECLDGVVTDCTDWNRRARRVLRRI